MKRYVSALVIIVVLVLGLLWFIESRDTPSVDFVACTEEAKLCPDGSYVGRTVPSCEFEECPTVVETMTAAGISPYDSGVRGSVLIGPTCPVERIPPDPSCADKPYATAIVVSRANAKTPFVVGNSDATGAFKFSLPPGMYTVTASNGAKFPVCATASVEVTSQGYTPVTISCDSGIR